MSVRLLLTDEAGAEIAPILTALPSRAGSPPGLSARMVSEAVLSLARPGTPWRDLPEECGSWDAVDTRWRRGEQPGRGRQLWERLPTDASPWTRPLFLEATRVRAPQHAAGALKKNGGHAAQALGRSRGGLSPKRHAGDREERTGIAVVLTAGPGHESPGCEPVLAQVPATPSLLPALMEKGYASARIREQRLAHDVVSGRPPKRNRTASLGYDHDLYKVREKVERFFTNLKQCRRIATRYEQLSQTFLALMHLVAAWIIIK
jgi:transposase